MLDDNLKHCYCVRWDGYNWIGVFPQLGHTNIMILPFGPLDTIQDVVQNESCSAIIHAKIWRESMRIRSPYPVVFSCVEQIKAILGIRKMFVLTPKQLFKYLKGEGHEWTVFKTKDA